MPNVYLPQGADKNGYSKIHIIEKTILGEVTMKNKWINNSAFILIFVLIIAGFSFLRSEVDQISLLIAFDKIITNVISSIWNLITAPAVFISTLTVLLLWKYKSEILAIIPYIREVKAGSVSALFESPADRQLENSSKTTIGESASEVAESGILLSDNKKTLEVRARFVGKASIKYLFDLDGKLLNPKQAVDKFRQHLKMLEKDSVNKKDESYQFTYYFGCYETYMTYIGSIFVDTKISEDKMTVYYSLKPDSKEILTSRMNEIDEAKKSKK